MEHLALGYSLPERRSKSRSRLSNLASSYFFRVPYCVPYWTGPTVLALVRCILTGQVIRGSDISRLGKRLADYLNIEAVLPCGNGRTALELALRTTGITESAEVVVPTFCCKSIVPPITACGAVPVFADIGEELNLTAETVEQAITSRTKAVVVPHLFGNPADISAILELCHGGGISVVDDAAQALGAKIAGRPVGTLGDAGVVSFGRGKVCFGTGGGALACSSQDIFNRANAFPLASAGWSDAVQVALSVLVWRKWRRYSLPFYRLIGKFGSQGPGSDSYRRQAMRNLDAAVAHTLMDTLDQNLKARRERVSAYHTLLQAEPRVTLFPHRTGSACLTQVIAVDGSRGSGIKTRDLVVRLRSKGYEVDGSYTPLHLAPEYRHFAKRPLENAESIRDTLIELPCEPSVSLKEVANISEIIRSCLA